MEDTGITNGGVLEKRTHCYVLRPKAFGVVSGCPCKNADPDWSEYQGRVWCAACGLDSVPSDGGIFDGPVPVEVCGLFGIHFTRFEIGTGVVERFDSASGVWIKDK